MKILNLKLCRLGLLAGLTLAVLLQPERAGATTRTVTTTSDSGAGSLRQAIIDSAAGDTVNFSVTVALIGRITLTSGELPIGRNLTITGPGANILTVSGNNASRVFDISSGITVNISNLTISNGRSTVFGDPNGGGIYNVGTLTINNCTLSGNNTTAVAGGIYNGGTVTINNSTFSGNSGCGLYNGGTATINNSTFSGNNSGAIPGGAINNSGTVTINNCTISGNSASNNGGGIFNSSSLIILNTIVANNAVPHVGYDGPDVYGTVSSHGRNLIGRTDGSSGWVGSDLLGGTGDATRLDPQLGPLQDNGGPTFTMALLPTSAAIDTGDDSVLSPPYNLATDQRGVNRRVGDHVDIGAFEFNHATRLVTTLNNSGGGSLRDAISIVNDSDRILFAPVVRGKIRLTSGELLINRPLSIVGPGAAQLAISGNTNSRVFRVGPQGNVDLYNLTITEGRLVGFNGVNGDDIEPNEAVPGGAGENVGGGGIWNDGALRLFDCMITSNSVQGGRGGTGGNNRSLNLPAAQGGLGGDGFGGGIFNQGSLELVRCTLLGNTIQCGAGGMGGGPGLGSSNRGGGPGGPGGVGEGAGIYGLFSATLENCTLAGNRVTGGTGGIGAGGTPAGLGGPGGTASGGALSGPFMGSFILRSCTVSDNSVAGGAGGAGGVSGAVAGGGANFTSVDLLNTLIAGNTGSPNSPDMAGAVTSQGWNLIGITDGSSGWTTNDFLGNTTFPLNPLLGACQDNGGPVWTMCPLAGSPARDKGKSDLATDARSGRRTVDFPAIPNAPDGDGSDIGALEVDSLFGILSLTKSNTFARARFKTDPGTSYTLQQTSLVTNRTWTNIVGAVIPGNGQALELSDPGPLPPTRFYRVRAD